MTILLRRPRTALAASCAAVGLYLQPCAAAAASQSGSVAVEPAAESPRPSAYESRFADVRGVRLHYLDFGGTGLPLIFVHDWYEDAHTWTTMAPPFADAHRVLAMTRRGYGQSDDVGWGYDVATQAEDILGFMDALGIERAVLVGRHPTTQDMTWIAEHHPQRLAGLVYLYHAIAPSPGDARILRDRTFAEMFYRYGGCWMGAEAFERAAPRLPYRPHYMDDADRRIHVPALSFTHPQDFAAGMGALDLLDATLAGATSADPGGGFCDAASIEASVAWLTALARDAERLAAARALVPTTAERRGYAEAFERAFGSNLRVVRLDGQPDYRTDPDAYIPHMRSFLAGSVRSDTVHVAPPTGEREADRASILAALARVQPGGTVQFAPGTYLVGRFIEVAVPRITLLGHPDGTTIRGCEPAGFAHMAVALAECNGLNLTGGGQTVRALAFEHTWHALVLGGLTCEAGACRPVSPPIAARTGGYLVEGSTFRESQNGIRVVGEWSEPAVIRDNRFINTYHAVVVNGMTAHIVDNLISVPGPQRVPYTRHPGGALAIMGWDAPDQAAFCDNNVIAGNRITGHPDAILITVAPGGACRGNEIRDNIIESYPVRFTPPSTPVTVRSAADSTVAGVPIALLNGVFGDGTIENNLIEGNRIVGASGLAVQVTGASRNRIVNNTISGVASREPFPGNTLFSGRPGWGEANGSGIWISPGSVANEIVGNTFADIAQHAVVLEGDRNIVETRSGADDVRDLGSGNRVSLRPAGPTIGTRGAAVPRDAGASFGEAAPRSNEDVQAVESAIRGYLDAYAAMDPSRLRTWTTDDFLLIENGYTAGLDRVVEGMDPTGSRPFTHYALRDLEIEVDGDIAVYRLVVDWYRGENRADGGIGTGHLRRLEGRWRLARDHMTLLPGRHVSSAAALAEYAGEYRGLDTAGTDDRLRLELDGDRLFMIRPDGRPLFGGIRRLELIPDAAGAFHLEFWGGLVEFERGVGGGIETLVYVPPPRMPAAYRQPLRYARVR